MKTATINIYKALVLADVDAATFKRVDGVLAAESDQLKNAVSSDSEEHLDMNMLHGYMENRDAEIRESLAFALVDDDDDLSVTNELDKANASFAYKLQVPDGFNKGRLASLARLIHNYIVQGTLLSWYANQNMQANVSEEVLEDIELSIVCALRVGFTKKPLQPFGPR